MPKLLVALWIAAIVPAILAIEAYQAAPGRVGAPQRGMSASDRPRLLLFLHPRCPCSTATLASFGEILAAHTAPVDAEVVFVRPPQTDASWEQTPLYAAAARLPGVSVRTDDSGSEAKQLGAATSGHAVLFSANGKLLFSGGLTPGRGASGDSAGRQALAAALQGTASSPVATPVYGCPLLTPGDCPRP